MTPEMRQLVGPWNCELRNGTGEQPASQVRRCHMPRKGWSDAQWSRSWIHALVVPRPPSVRWPHATQSSTQQQGRWRQPHPPPKTGVRAPHPDEKVSVAQERVSKLEAALRAVGDDDETAPSLREALKRARQQAVPLSTQDKVTQCESFLERARKREAGAKELVLQAQKELARLSAEVVEGEQRLATLRAELERPQPPVVPVDMSAEVERLRVEQLSKEKEDGRPEVETHLQARRFVHSSDPAVEVQKVRSELMDMHKERDALKAALEAQRNCMDTSGPASPGTRMSALIDDAAKRRCLEGS